MFFQKPQKNKQSDIKKRHGRDMKRTKIQSGGFGAHVGTSESRGLPHTPVSGSGPQEDGVEARHRAHSHQHRNKDSGLQPAATSHSLVEELVTRSLNRMFALAGVVQWIECQPGNQRVAGSIPRHSTCLGCGPGPWWGGMQEATTH